jgi:multidrug efflux pump
MDIVKLAINNARLTISVLLFLMLAGAVAYQSTPKEAEPDVPIPIMYVSLIYQGISPEDSERLLLRPMETKLKSRPSIWRRRCRIPAARCRMARPTCRRRPKSRP